MAKLIDTCHQGRESVIGAWLDDEVIIDPGPASTLDTLLEGLAGVEPRAILLTHIHLDHAAATGALVERFPGLTVYVHEIGGPHMVDPSRLWESASRLYGEDRMLDLWGEVLPVHEDRIQTLEGGETVEGFDVLHTPGHASHHLTYTGADGSAYVGDVAGVRISPGELTVMPTPPPEIDLEAWHASLDALVALDPARLRLTHFGEIVNGPRHLAEARESLEWTAALSRSADRETFLDELGARIDEQPEVAASSMLAAMPPDQVWMGLERYWRKREPDGTSSGEAATS